MVTTTRRLKMVLLGFKKLHEDAKVPEKSHPGDAGMDVRSIEDVDLEPYVPTLVKIGLAVDIPDGYELQVRPRSGLALKGVTVWNAPGTIDSGYKGEIGVILIWSPHQKYFNGIDSRRMRISKGDRIAQLVLAPVVECVTCEVSNVGLSERRTGGFGSTGV
jgi:dUTP pyrophosphatase